MDMQNPKERMEGSARPQGPATKPAEPTIKGVGDTMKEKMHDVATGVSDLVTKTKDTAQDWASSAADAAGHAKDRAVQMASTTAHKVGDAGEELNALIHRYPVQAVLVGCGVGFLLGLAVQRMGTSRS
jgi:ElaB/YqjD/DUF883 family membrane-anchored ribosome-binding protein